MATLSPSPSNLIEDNTSLVDHETIARQFFDITKLLTRDKSQTLSDIETNYAKEICEWLDSFIKFIWNKSCQEEVIAFFESFESRKELSREQITRFINLVNALEDIDKKESYIVESVEPKKFRKIEMLRGLFVAFGLVSTEIIAWVVKPPSNPLINIYHSYVESGGEYTGRLYIDADAIVYFIPDEDAPGHIFTHLRKEITQKQTPLTLIVTNTTPNRVVEILEGDTRGWATQEDELAQSVWTHKSKAKIWNEQRRMRAQKNRQWVLDNQLKQENQELYDTQLEKLRALSSFLHERFEELRNHLLIHIPYIAEVSEYIALMEALKLKWYEVETLDVNEVKRGFEQLIQSYTREIWAKKSKNIKLAQAITSLSDTLVNASTREQETIRRSIERNEWRITKNTREIEWSEGEKRRLQKELNDLLSQVTGYRLHHIPHSEEFTLALYHSLRAEELYHAPDYIDQTPIDQKWIYIHILPLFVDILWRHLDELHGVNIWELSQLIDRIDAMPDEYDEDIAIPDIERISQRKIQDFFSMLLPIIPEDYLTVIPELPTTMSPESTHIKPTPPTESPKPKKTNQEIREWKKIKKSEILKERNAIAEELRKIETSLMEYEQYWKEKIKKNLKTRRAYSDEIQKIQLWIKRTQSHPMKSSEELEILIAMSKAEEIEIQWKITDSWLLKDELAYKILLSTRTQFSRKIQRTK